MFEFVSIQIMWSFCLINVCHSLCPSLVLPQNAVFSGQCRGIQNSGSVCAIHCTNGYIREGSPERVCHSNGLWSGTATRCIHRTGLPQRCPPIRALENGFVRDSCNWFGIGCELTFQCYNNFKLNGIRRIRCLRGGHWSANKPKCIRRNGRGCTPIEDPENGSVLNSCANRFLIGCELTFKCNDGFKLDGNQQIQCLRPGKWSTAQPHCDADPKPDECPRLPAPVGGYWVNRANYHECNGTPGQTCNLFCDRGYKRVGPAFVHCDSETHKWSQPIPDCVPFSVRNCRNNCH